MLFDNTPTPDADALAVLAAVAIPRETLQAEGYQNLAKSSDLFGVGYSVSHWLKPDGTRSEVLEYVPRDPAARPRLTATNYAEQCAVHEALGLRVVAPGRRYLN